MEDLDEAEVKMIYKILDELKWEEAKYWILMPYGQTFSKAC
jgi:hypothetical protein